MKQFVKGARGQSIFSSPPSSLGFLTRLSGLLHPFYNPRVFVTLPTPSAALRFIYFFSLSFSSRPIYHDLFPSSEVVRFYFTSSCNNYNSRWARNERPMGCRALPPLPHQRFRNGGFIFEPADNRSRELNRLVLARNQRKPRFLLLFLFFFFSLCARGV